MVKKIVKTLIHPRNNSNIRPGPCHHQRSKHPINLEFSYANEEENSDEARDNYYAYVTRKELAPFIELITDYLDKNFTGKIEPAIKKIDFLGNEIYAVGVKISSNRNKTKIDSFFNDKNYTGLMIKNGPLDVESAISLLRNANVAMEVKSLLEHEKMGELIVDIRQAVGIILKKSRSQMNAEQIVNLDKADNIVISELTDQALLANITKALRAAGFEQSKDYKLCFSLSNENIRSENFEVVVLDKHEMLKSPQLCCSLIDYAQKMRQNKGREKER